MPQSAALSGPRASAAARTGSASSGSSAASSANPRLSAQQWHSSLACSPQLRADLSAQGVDVRALQAYASRAHSRAPELHLLKQFLDPKPRVVPEEVHEMQQTLAAQAEGTRPVSHASTRGWDPSAGQIDWALLNGSREVSLSVGETAAALPDSESGRRAAARLLGGLGGGAFAEQRRTDRRTGHKLDFVMPRPGERFVRDAYYSRVEDLRKSQQGKAPHMRLPEPVLYNGECREQQPKDEQQRRVVEAHYKAQQARSDNLAQLTRHKWGPTSCGGAGDASGSKDEWTGVQRKRGVSDGGHAAKPADTAARVFHTDLPVDANGLRGVPRSAAAVAREQHLRDRATHGRDYEPLAGTRITTVPPSLEAQQRLRLSGPNAVGQHRMDQQREQMAVES